MYIYVCVIYRLGPLTNTWCMRMEAKNSYFKRAAQIGNFKNIALSVANRHQRLMCALLNSTDFFNKSVEKLPSKLIFISITIQYSCLCSVPLISSNC